MIDPIIHEWGSLLIRWAHVITAIAWIGSSFYFMHLDASLKTIPEIPAGRGGATWEVHGGGFYEVRKYLQAPAHLPQELIWHKWQAYSTWITGFFLLVWVYYAQADLYLIDPAVRELSPLAGATIGIAALALGWVVYDFLCKSSLATNDVALAAAGFAFIMAMAYLFQQMFSGRAAMLHTGALMATWMSANVFLVIIPGQKKTIAELLAGRAPDPKWGRDAKIRSTHNNYLTLPVLFLMLSGHYPLVWSTPYAWIIVGLTLVAGAVVRHFYNQRHAGKGDPWWTWLVAALCIWASAWISMASAPIGRERLGLAPLPDRVARASEQKAPAHVANIIVSRCSMCHGSLPVYAGVAIAPKGILLDTPEMIARNREAIFMQSALTHAMPPNNVVGMTQEERRIVAQWLAHGK